MTDFIESSISTLFPVGVSPFAFVGQISCSIDDPEAVKETKAFLNYRWPEITPDMWRKNFTAVSFFSDYAFFYFVPSLIMCSFIDGRKTHLAVDSLISTLSPCSSPILTSWRRHQWEQFDHRQLAFIIYWMENLGSELSEYFSTDEVAEAVVCLKQFADTAKKMASDMPE